MIALVELIVDWSLQNKSGVNFSDFCALCYKSAIVTIILRNSFYTFLLWPKAKYPVDTLIIYAVARISRSKGHLFRLFRRVRESVSNHKSTNGSARAV